jgi:hypothetical protein
MLFKVAAVLALCTISNAESIPRNPPEPFCIVGKVAAWMAPQFVHGIGTSVYRSEEVSDERLQSVAQRNTGSHIYDVFPPGEMQMILNRCASEGHDGMLIMSMAMASHAHGVAYVIKNDWRCNNLDRYLEPQLRELERKNVIVYRVDEQDGLHNDLHCFQQVEYPPTPPHSP